MHRITTDLVCGIIEVQVEGFWTVEHLEDFKRDLRRALIDASVYVRAPKTLYNYTDAAIQSQEVVKAMQALANDPSLAGRRVAMYTDGQLARMQARRVSEQRDDMQVFDDRASAIAWLLRPEEGLAERILLAAGTVD